MVCGVRYGVRGCDMVCGVISYVGTPFRSAARATPGRCGMPPSLQGRLETTWNSASPSPEPASRPDEEIK